MFTLIARIVSWFATNPTERENASPAGYLMNSADACAGTNPRHAQELRQAAYAYISVVR